MSADFDPAADFVQITDHAETVTLLRRGAMSVDAGTVIHNALRRALRSGEFAARNRNDTRQFINSDGQCIAADTNWHLPAVELDKPPSIGDVIIDADNRRWTILEMALMLPRTRWPWRAREWAIAKVLAEPVTILQAE